MAYCILCGDLRTEPHLPDCPFDRTPAAATAAEPGAEPGAAVIETTVVDEPDGGAVPPAAAPAAAPPGSGGGLIALVGLGLAVAAVGGVLLVRTLSDADTAVTPAASTATTTPAPNRLAAAPVPSTTAVPTTVAPTTTSVPVATTAVPAGAAAPTTTAAAAAPLVAAGCPAGDSRPVTGTELGQVRAAGLGTLTVDNGLGTDATVKLVGLGGAPTSGVMHRYVRSGERLVVATLPPGSYRVLFEEGLSWNDALGRFMCRRAVSGFDQPVVFDQSTAGGNVVRSEWTVTLQPVAAPNASVSPVDPTGFDSA